MDDIQSRINRFELRRRRESQRAVDRVAWGARTLARRTRTLDAVRNLQAIRATFLFDRDGAKPFQLFRILQAYVCLHVGGAQFTPVFRELI